MGKNKHVVLIGLMGSGKSTVARLLSRETGMPVSDSDAFLRSRYGSTAAEIAATQGVDVLHEREAEHVLDALDRPPAVITAASSVVERPEVRQALREALVVWLDAPDEVLARRMKSGDHRPPFAPAVMRARREPYFRELADLAFRSGTPGETAKNISGHLS